MASSLIMHYEMIVEAVKYGTYEIIASCSERLHGRRRVIEYFVGFPNDDLSPTQIVYQAKGARPHEDKIKDQGYEDAENESNICDNVVTLQGEHDKDGV